MDPLSDVSSLLKPESYISGGFHVDVDMANRQGSELRRSDGTGPKPLLTISLSAAD
jgi:hypothetical protein